MSQNVGLNRRERRVAARANGSFATRARRPIAVVSGASMAMTVASIIAPAMAHAATLNVTTSADSGVGSLRDALASASDGDVITFASSVTLINLNAPLDVTHGVTIDGPGASHLTIDGQNKVQDLIVDNASHGTVSVSGLTIAHGAGATGGGIEVKPGANLSLTKTVVANNAATTSGGGIWVSNGDVALDRTTIRGNSAPSGGGIFADIQSGSTVNVLRSTISGNTAGSGQGGGLYLHGPSGAPTQVAQTSYYCGGGGPKPDAAPRQFDGGGGTVVGNQCQYPAPRAEGHYACSGDYAPEGTNYTDRGGDVCYYFNEYDATYNAETYSYYCEGPYAGGFLSGDYCYYQLGSHAAKYYPGHYFCESGSLTYNGEYAYCDTPAQKQTTYVPVGPAGAGVVTISTSTISGNSSPAGKAAVYLSGFNTSSTIGSSTIASNTGDGLGVAGTAHPNLAATIIAGNTKDCASNNESDAGYNLDGDGSCGLTGTGSVSAAPGIAAALGALHNNGGPTQTMALALTSDPAHGIVPAGFSVPGGANPVCDTNDQRGVAAAGAPCDVGAFQIEAAPGISASVRYRHHHRSAVVTFHCVSASPAISITCSPPAHVHGAGSHTVMGTVTAQDGRTASVSKTVVLARPPAHIRVATTTIDSQANRTTRHSSYTVTR